MDWANAWMAGWLSLVFFYHPEPDYMGLWFEQTMRSNVLPYIPGV
ncbi:hypothetical protein [Cupriavidus necator]|uniref:Uncharacterized protein n=1 Tax=Cupriavidus necator TaxID=106590 RepID=A0A1K0IE00_CUPNE|nr:hypothetical protein CNECB9_2370123 [Cupriavidus necator]